ncbi:MAG: 3-isopropylmalate/(R)-2-methylmalate dehydratase small subunit [Synergistales bacterium]|jgi:3-isopropylmalate dehydratase small subunit|nr:3-isopropylmalate/(R)-2-methylmalate dehydratase small subunit [Synergistales bacterium]
MVIKGKAHVFNQDNINADSIIPGSAISKAAGLDDLLSFLFEDLRPRFAQTVTKGDVIFAGANFGAGSSREHAALMIRHCGIEAVVARSFSRNFFRNAVNIGLAVIETDWEGIQDGDDVIVELEKGLIKVRGKNTRVTFPQTSGFVLEIMRSGGLIPLYNRERHLFRPGRL